MVTAVRRTDQSEGAFRGLGDVIHETSERNRVTGETAADEKALRNSIHKLGENASPRQILDAITGTRTYSPQAKQNALKNYLGVSEFEELQRKGKVADEANKLKAQQQNLEKEAKITQEKGSAAALIDNSTLPEEQKTQLKQGIEAGLVSYDAVKQLTKPNKQQIQQAEEDQSKNITQKAFDDLVGLIPQVGRSGILSSFAGGDTAKAYAQFTSLTGALESLLVEKVNRGALSNARFKYITETLLPKPSDTQAEIEGKLTGLATILDLDASTLKGNASQNKPSLSSFKKG